MANFGNLTTQMVQDELAASYEPSPNTPLPAWWFEKPCSMLTAYERGFWFGRQVRLSEMGMG